MIFNFVIIQTQYFFINVNIFTKIILDVMIKMMYNNKSNSMLKTI